MGLLSKTLLKLENSARVARVDVSKLKGFCCDDDSRVKWTNVFQLIEPQCATLQSFSSPPTPFPPKIDQKGKQNCFYGRWKVFSLLLMRSKGVQKKNYHYCHHHKRKTMAKVVQVFIAPAHGEARWKFPPVVPLTNARDSITPFQIIFLLHSLRCRPRLSINFPLTSVGSWKHVAFVEFDLILNLGKCFSASWVPSCSCNRTLFLSETNNSRLEWLRNVPLMVRSSRFNFPNASSRKCFT